jgi:hypothetical protein
METVTENGNNILFGSEDYNTDKSKIIDESQNNSCFFGGIVF